MEKVNFGAIDVENITSVLKVFPRLQGKVKQDPTCNKLLTAGGHRMEAWSYKPWSEQVRQNGGFPTTVLSACIWNWPNASVRICVCLLVYCCCFCCCMLLVSNFCIHRSLSCLCHLLIMFLKMKELLVLVT